MESEWEKFLPALANRAPEPSNGGNSSNSGHSGSSHEGIDGNDGGGQHEAAAEAQPPEPAADAAPARPETEPAPAEVVGRPAPTEKIDDLVEKAKYLFGPEHVTVLE
jgi:DNA polymerase-3 subunit gamma/tau